MFFFVVLFNYNSRSGLNKEKQIYFSNVIILRVIPRAHTHTHTHTH